MRLTSKYSLEDWDTGEIVVFDIPDAVLDLSLETVLTSAFGEVRTVEMNTIELLFCCIFLRYDWQVVRPPLNRASPADQPLAVALEQVTSVEADALHQSGVPDFFLWSQSGEHRFVEVKASEDSLNSNQRDWVGTYDLNFCIAQLAPAEDITDEEIKRKNRIRADTESDR